ncbi:MAG: molybdopterin-dependent oxidoreductase Mo/Fe-S-binding subunit [Desulfobacteraceae bacterium]|nr:molybdopterin-dependent oxidoreductase Mo/Fe-S-binding subunit [Desulfobacteraceae bacterium]
MKIEITLNDTPKTIYTEPGENVRHLLEREGIVSVRNGCDAQGVCGSCAIILDGRVVNSCLLVASQIDGKNITTVESLATCRELSPVQSALVDTGIVQCGYCTPPMELAIEDLLKREENPTREQVKDALSGSLCRCTGYEQIFTAVEIAKQRLKDPGYTQKVAPDFRDDLRIVGKAGQKVDGPKLARGEKAFVEDMTEPRTCHLKMLRSPYAHAYISSIDTSEAEKIPGVVYILTHENAPDIYYTQAGQGFPEPSPYDRRLMSPKVLHVGDRVVAVLAESPEIAEQAISKIKVEYEVLKPVLTIEEAMSQDAPIIRNAEIEYLTGAPEDLDNSNIDPREGKIIYRFPIGEDPRKNLAASSEGGIGDVDKGFGEADVILESEYETTQVHCTPLEPHVVYTRMDGDRLIIHASTQTPWCIRRTVARALNISENKIRVIKERVGGGFGSKQDILLEELAAYLTWTTGRSVLFRYTRDEDFIASSTRHPMKIKVKLGAKKDGQLTAMYMDVKANTGPYGNHCLTVPVNAVSKSMPLLLCENVGFDVKVYYSNIPPTGAYQGYGAPQGAYALQTALAELAVKLGMDQLELIEKNRVREGVMLEILKCLGEGREGKPERVASCGLGPALKKGAEMIEWGRKEESSDPDVKIGQGVVIVQQGSGLPGLDSASAVIRMLGDGTFTLLIGGADLGNGLDTVAVKVAAECLCTDMDKITILSGDTDATPFDVGAYASSGTYFTGNAALAAARLMKENILEVAAGMLKEDKQDLQIVYPGIVKGKNSSITYQKIETFSEKGVGGGQLVASASFTTEDSAFPYGAHFCQVAVSTRTGEVKIQKYYALQDCGTPINPELALGQIYGGVLKSIGHALYEEMVLDDTGRCINTSLRDYKAPMINDLPEDFRSELVFTEDPFGPFGGKSVGEISSNGAAPAIAIAIHAAVGVWIRQWPFTPEKILRALGKI